jgi:hypothetical protein
MFIVSFTLLLTTNMHTKTIHCDQTTNIQTNNTIHCNQTTLQNAFSYLKPKYYETLSTLGFSFLSHHIRSSLDQLIFHYSSPQNRWNKLSLYRNPNRSIPALRTVHKNLSVLLQLFHKRKASPTGIHLSNSAKLVPSGSKLVPSGSNVSGSASA